MEKIKGNSSIIQDAILLFLITLIAAVLLGLVNEITKDPIAEQEAKAKAEAYKKVFDTASYIDIEDEVIKLKVAESKNLLSEASILKVSIDEAGIAKDDTGTPVGYVMTVTSPNGYSGNITITMGYTPDKKVTKIEFITINETSGFGLEAKEESYKNQYNNKSGEYMLRMTEGSGRGEVIDGISGATKTSKAVIEAVNAGIIFANDLLAEGVGGF